MSVRFTTIFLLLLVFSSAVPLGSYEFCTKANLSYSTLFQKKSFIFFLFFFFSNQTSNPNLSPISIISPNRPLSLPSIINLPPSLINPSLHPYHRVSISIWLLFCALFKPLPSSPSAF